MASVRFRIRTIKMFFCIYCVNMDKFKFGFYSAAIPEAAYHKKFLIVPENKNLEEILHDLTFCQTFDRMQNSLTCAMEQVIHMSKKEIENKINNLFYLVCKNTWKNVAEKMMGIFNV